MTTPTPRSRRFRTEQAGMTELAGVLGRHDTDRKRVAEEFAAKWNDDKRRQAVKDGNALPGPDGVGRFPITDQADMDHAAGLVGSSKTPRPVVEAHMKRMAKKHGLTLPKTLQSSSATS